MTRRAPLRLAAAAAALCLGLVACGTDEEAPAAGPQDTVQASPDSEPTTGTDPATECAPAPATGPAPEGISADLAQQPEPAVADGPPPCDLVVQDVVEGTGEPAVEGQTLTVKYVGVLHSTGEEFDSSWSRGADETFPLTLGAGEVIEGWDRGLVGVREGGRRQLTIPPELGYGPMGQGPIPPDATLVFVVDVVSVD
jgi:hypothetical protein